LARKFDILPDNSTTKRDSGRGLRPGTVPFLLDIKKAKYNWIEFNNIPKNSLYLIHCLNGGIEERIFTVKKDGMIRWW